MAASTSAPAPVQASEPRLSAHAAGPIATALLLGACVVLDAGRPLPEGVAILLGLLLLAGLGHALHLRLSTALSSRRLDLQLSAFVVVGAYAVVQRLDGGLGGPSFPLVYLCVVAISAFTRSAAALGAVGIAFGLELAVQAVAAAPISTGQLLLHLCLEALFAAANAFSLSKEQLRAAKTSQAQFAAEVERLREEARHFRLTTAPAESNTRAESRADDERLVRSGLEEIHLSVLLALKLLRGSLGLHTALLLWVDETTSQLRVSELCSEGSSLVEGPFQQGDGILGAAIRGQAPVQVSGLKSSYKLPYYTGPCPVRAVYALPIVELSTVRGVLVVDRKEDRAFSEDEAALIAATADQALRAVRNVQVFVQLERARTQQAKLYRAAGALGAAMTEAEVMDSGLRSAREITSVDFAALTCWDATESVHEVRAVHGDTSGALQGYRFGHNNGLVSMVVDNRHALPFRGEYDGGQQVVFSRKAAPPNLPSLVVLPLLVRDQPLGTLVLGSRVRGAFAEETRGTLQVLASHLAVSLANARMVQRLEELATTDGLTGLLNKRVLLDLAAEKLKAARRFDRPLSILVTDLDFFKKVNDTFGHGAGDLVLKGLGTVLTRNKRATDSVARFGGEEFVVLCEETDARGALLLAERVREELQRTEFAGGTDGEGRLRQVKVTCSIGIATFPVHGTTWDELFTAADKALYASKGAGRNRTTIAPLPTATARLSSPLRAPTSPSAS